MKNLITHLRTSPRPVSGLVQVNAQGMKKNKSMHKITSTARKDKGPLKVTRSCGDTKLTVPPRKPVKTTLLLGGGSSSPNFRHRSCHSFHDLPLAKANGSGWRGDHTAMESSPVGPPDVSRGERAFSEELGSSELLPSSHREGESVSMHAHVEKPTEVRAQQRHLRPWLLPLLSPATAW